MGLGVNGLGQRIDVLECLCVISLFADLWTGAVVDEMAQVSAVVAKLRKPDDLYLILLVHIVPTGQVERVSVDEHMAVFRRNIAGGKKSPVLNPIVNSKRVGWI